MDKAFEFYNKYLHKGNLYLGEELNSITNKCNNII